MRIRKNRAVMSAFLRTGNDKNCAGQALQIFEGKTLDSSSGPPPYGTLLERSNADRSHERLGWIRVPALSSKQGSPLARSSSFDSHSYREPQSSAMDRVRSRNRD